MTQRGLPCRRPKISVILTLALVALLYLNAAFESPVSQESDRQEAQVDGVKVASKTRPSFQIWLFPPQEDIISRKIQASGLYEPEETQFIQYVASRTSKGGWAVDIGANIGFHSLHMAALGTNVIAFEPSPDTASLLERSIRENNIFDGGGSVQIVRAAAAEVKGFGRLVRHRDSAGMTILQLKGDSSELPFGVEDVIADNIPTVRPEDYLSKIMPKDATKNLQMLKVDAEGHELHAFRGVNLERFPFQFVTFEFFPELLWKAGQTDPVELLIYIQFFRYSCATHPKELEDDVNLLTTLDDFTSWYQSKVVPELNKSSKYHLNLYCRKGT